MRRAQPATTPPTVDDGPASDKPVDATVTERPMRSVESYLAAIYLLDEEGTELIRARLSERLGHSAPAVSEMITRLAHTGLVEVVGRRIVLTPAGRLRAETTVRRHRLAERLLVDVIGVDWTVAHREATRIEQVISDQLEPYLVQLLGNPTTSSMGTPIPGVTGTPIAARPLHDTGPTQHVRIAQISETLQGDQDAIRFLAGHGLAPGVEITVEARAPDGTLTVTLNGRTLAIGPALSRQIRVAQPEPTLPDAPQPRTNTPPRFPTGAPPTDNPGPGSVDETSSG